MGEFGICVYIYTYILSYKVLTFWARLLKKRVIGSEAERGTWSQGSTPPFSTAKPLPNQKPQPQRRQDLLVKDHNIGALRIRIGFPLKGSMRATIRIIPQDVEGFL